MTSQAEPSARVSPLSRGRLWGVRALVLLGSLLLLVSVLAIWVDRLALQTETWADTSEQLLEQEEVQQALGAYITDQLYASVDVRAQLESVLPENLDPLAGVAAAGLREYVQRATTELLGRPRVIAAWRRANEVAHGRFVLLIDDRGNAIRTNGGQVTLQLRPLLEAVVERTGLGERVVSRLPEGAGEIVVVEADNLEAVQRLVRILQLSAAWLWAVALAFFALAIYLSRGRRRQTIKGIAFGWVVVGVAVLAIVRLGVPRISDSLAAAPVYADAARSALEIVMASLRDGARTVTAVGLIALLGAWLAGPGRRAIAFRRWSAPYLVQRPELLWTAYTLLVLLILVWGPTGATRRLLGIVLIFGLGALGLELLRRLVVREYPDAALAEDWSIAGSAGAAVGRIRGRGRHGEPPDAGTDTLARLNALRASGALSDEEFVAEKGKLLGS